MCATRTGDRESGRPYALVQCIKALRYADARVSISKIVDLFEPFGLDLNRVLSFTTDSTDLKDKSVHNFLIIPHSRKNSGIFPIFSVIFRFLNNNLARYYFPQLVVVVAIPSRPKHYLDYWISLASAFVRLVENYNIV